MSIVYVTEQGSELSVKGNRLLLQLKGKTLRNYLIDELERIVLFGKVKLSPNAIETLLDRDIDTIFLSYHGSYRGRLQPKMPKNVELRLTQYERYKDPKFSVNFCKGIVSGKIANSISLLRRFNWRHKDSKVSDNILQIKGLLERIEFQDDIDSIRGIEGASASIYFDSLKRLVRNELFVFSNRTRRPPQDPANAVLSFLYTLLFQLVESAVYLVGLDPFVGFFHTVDFGKPALALDLMEEFRPIMDRLFLRLSNRKMLSTGDFFFREYEGKEDEHGVYLSHEGIKKVIAAFQSEMKTKRLYSSEKLYPLEGIVIEQVRAAARSIRDASPYTPYIEE